MVHKTFIASSITVRKPPNASLAVTHKTYWTISHASCKKRRKIQHLCLNCHRALIYVANYVFFVTTVGSIHAMVMCWNVVHFKSLKWLKIANRARKAQCLNAFMTSTRLSTGVWLWYRPAVIQIWLFWNLNLSNHLPRWYQTLRMTKKEIRREMAECTFFFSKNVNLHITTFT